MQNDDNAALQEQAMEMLLDRIDLPRFTLSTGGRNTSALVQDIAEDLHHEEWVGDPDHWLWEMVERAIRKEYKAAEAG